MATRQQIVEHAKTWIGTKFRYQGRIKRNSSNLGGVDCLGLIIGICDEVGYRHNGQLLSSYDTIIYSRKPDYTLLKKLFSEFFIERDPEKIDIGDIVLKQITREQYHLMVFTGVSFIHASATTFSVVEHGVDNLDNCTIYSLFKTQ